MGKLNIDSKGVCEKCLGLQVVLALGFGYGGRFLFGLGYFFFVLVKWATHL